MFSIPSIARAARPLSMCAAAAIACQACGQLYRTLGSIPILLSDPQGYLSSCRRHLVLLEQAAAAAVRALEEQMRAADVLPLTKARGRGMIDAIGGQIAEISAILHPLLPGDGPDPAGDSPSTGVPSPLMHIDYLFRDWGWPVEPNGENERALASLEAVLERQPLGRTIVVGAGACRLAYDLHRRDSGVETVVVDIHPLLFTVAHAVIRGGTVSLKEANAEINELGQIAREWELTAPDGALDEERFHFLLADGLEPPFRPETFDTVVTPWFIDLIPADLRDFISTVHRLLKPGGRWLNLGPLRYTPDIPAARRFTREEVFDLAARAGFRIGTWHSDSVPYLVSRHNGRGKVEWVMAFAATKLAAPSSPRRAEGPPDWLIFRHLPIPTFPGQSLFPAVDPLTQLVISAIDGQRTLDDVALLAASRVKQLGLWVSQIREAVRQCLAEAHPQCRGE